MNDKSLDFTPFVDRQDPLLEQPEPTLGMHPRRFALWLFIVSIVMIFASMTSAYIVRKGQGNWTQFELPEVLWASTWVIIASSFSIQLAYFAGRAGKKNLLKLLMLGTFALGIVFLALQYQSWLRLLQINIYFDGNPSGSFLYVLTGLHAFHLVTGLVYLGIVTGMALFNKVKSDNVDLELVAIYWHFLDLLWLALFGFLVWSHGG